MIISAAKMHWQLFITSPCADILVRIYSLVCLSRISFRSWEVLTDDMLANQALYVGVLLFRTAGLQSASKKILVKRFAITLTTVLMISRTQNLKKNVEQVPRTHDRANAGYRTYFTA
jgi:hypothetical protein